MLTYNNSDVIQCLRQYDMFANSLNLVRNHEEREMIIKQITKLEQKILSLTNEIYEEEYYSLANKECDLLDDEKKRISMLIDLIDQRLSYVEKRCNEYYRLTGKTLDVNDVLGANILDNLEDKVKIIDKYTKNIKLYDELKDDVESLTEKINLASEKIDINHSLNKELEIKFKDVLSSAFEKLQLYDLLDNKEDIEYAYYETEKLLTLAELNLQTAKTSPVDILQDCQKMLEEVKEDYANYKDKLSILKLMEIFNKEVDTYDELLDKRQAINNLFNAIKNEDLIDMVGDIVGKQYSTILLEKQDVNTYDDLIAEKERKLEAISEIEEENNSEKFQSVLKRLIENERKKQERIKEEQRKIAEEERKKRIEIERKKQEEILKRQKIIEEARKKEMEKRTKEMLEEQQNSVLLPKNKGKKMNFEAIKDISDSSNENIEDEIVESRTQRKKNKVEEDFEKFEPPKEEIKETKNKSDIEKELFDEFNSIKLSSDDRKTEVEKEIDDNNKFPDMSIDDYMKNFDEKEIDLEQSGIFADDLFPTIPM